MKKAKGPHEQAAKKQKQDSGCDASSAIDGLGTSLLKGEQLGEEGGAAPPTPASQAQAGEGEEEGLSEAWMASFISDKVI